MSDGKNIKLVIDPSNLQGVTGNRNDVDARVNSPDESVIGAHARIHGDPNFSDSRGNKGNTSNNPMNIDNKSPLHVQGDDNNIDRRFNSPDQKVIRHHGEIIGSPNFGGNSGSSSKVDDESNDRDKKVGGTTGR